MLLQVMSLLGACCLLGAFFANSRGWIGATDRLYGVLNFVGALLLLWVAIADLRWGFILLEVAWAAIAIPTVLGPERARPLPKP